MFSFLKRIINYCIERRIDFVIWHKLYKINKKAKSLNSTIKNRNTYKQKWDHMGACVNPKYLALFYGINGKLSMDYVPENIYYNRIEPVLNNKAFALAYSDKNLYEYNMPTYSGYFPRSYLRCINGVFYNNKYEFINLAEANLFAKNEKVKLIIKPATETGGGKNIDLVIASRNHIQYKNQVLSILDFCYLMREKHCGSFVLQEYINQSEWFAAFNKSSLNTVRVFTYRSVKDEKTRVLHSVLRFGKEGNIVDNQASGGLSCGIGLNGQLNDFAVDKYGIKHVDFLKRQYGIFVPAFSEMKTLAISIASNYFYHRLLGFDICLDIEGNIRLLEVNCSNIEVNFLQMNNGPLFGKYTEEILEYCKKNRKTVVLDFDV